MDQRERSFGGAWDINQFDGWTPNPSMNLHCSGSFNQNLSSFPITKNPRWIRESVRERMEKRSGSEIMEKTKQLLELTQEESDAVEKLAVRPKKAGETCFYTFFALRGIQVDRVEPGLVVCNLKVPPRLTDRSGKLASGAIANLVDEIGCAVIYDETLPEPVSVDMSISYISPANVDDELEIVSRLLGQKGRYSGTSVLIKNKTTGEIVAEGRHSLFSLRPKL